MHVSYHPDSAPSRRFKSSGYHWRKIRTNNPLERIMKEIRRRIGVVGAFPDGQPCLNLGSGLIDQSQKMTVAAIAMADLKAWAQRS